MTPIVDWAKPVFDQGLKIKGSSFESAAVLQKTLLDCVHSFCNALDKDGLRSYYKEVLDNGQYSVHGGGGLGMIDIARKSGNKLEYDFSDVNDDFGLYILKIKV